MVPINVVNVERAGIGLLVMGVVEFIVLRVVSGEWFNEEQVIAIANIAFTSIWPFMPHLFPLTITILGLVLTVCFWVSIALLLTPAVMAIRKYRMYMKVEKEFSRIKAEYDNLVNDIGRVNDDIDKLNNEIDVMVGRIERAINAYEAHKSNINYIFSDKDFEEVWGGTHG
ncbi:MAG: hypothetical protein RXR08_12175 [Sulfolobaceae archaeon]